MKQDRDIKENIHCNCSTDPIEVQTQNACSCEDKEKFHGGSVPTEYFYNSCDCGSCDCTGSESVDDSEMLCSCGFMRKNPGLDYENYSCHCSGLNFFE